MNLRVVNSNIIVSIKSFYREKTVVFFRISGDSDMVFGTIFMERDNEIFDLDIQDLSRTKASAELVKAIGLSKRFKIYRRPLALMPDSLPRTRAGTSRSGHFPRTMKDSCIRSLS